MVKENPDYEYYKTTILSEASFEERIKKESESGSTCLACKNSGRNYIGIELDKKWFDMALNNF